MQFKATSLSGLQRAAISAVICLFSSPVIAGQSSECSPNDAPIWGDTTSWTAETGPAGREHAIMLFDAKRQRIILAGGTGYKPQLRPLADAWAFDIADRTWRPLEITGEAPALGGSRRASKLSDSGIALIYGGYDSKQAPLGDLYKMQASESALNFVKMDQENAPPARFLHAFVRSANENEYYTFGGVGTQLYNDAWRLTVSGDIGVWEQIETANAPSARYGFSYFHDERTNSLVIAGGADERFPSEYPNDFWSLSTGAENIWRKLPADENVSAKTGRRNPHFAFDGSTGRLLIFGGTSDGRTASTDNGFLTFSPEGDVSWRPLADGGPTPRASGMSIFDDEADSFWLGFGNAKEAYLDLTPLAECE
ncbi:kelch repeat-containing protein [Hyphococcus sp.]|uniref:kelch repeat-containing protein n=1 Tax=Hyphococcus sp. TaxID=2038636 RepID=UPI002082A64E|nr:MAG: hypothetical protein DHS20C04_06070 [Marinicaulis sp.]